MISMEAIADVRDQIVAKFHPEQIILFGSYAYGTPHEDSDVDLLVVLPFEGLSIKEQTAIRLAVHGGFPMDVIVYTPQRLKERLQLGDSFLREITEKGKVLYVTAH
ncbi:nucleotidyltransferase domain-containing protein [Armatimonas sp.]|uniref:nucleotidyltransferase domain-containing protein n=1 Tax=Armatimonas sp. TaxID=1872638 RepID=UPI00286B16A8|nr:nucleotidyltransferase domain-containing protein [Armatimonas sp.]